MATQTPRTAVFFKDPPFVRSLLGNPAWAWLWLVARVYVGYAWLTSGLGKLGNPAWMETGAALRGFWERAVAIPEAPARAPIAYDWYRAFLQTLLDGGHHVWFAKLITAGELLVGAALILGILTGFAAFFGGFMNWNFMLAGTASTNPVLFAISVALILAWKTAGWWGLDRWVLPLVGTPWQPGKLIDPAGAPVKSTCACGEACTCTVAA